MLLGLVAGEGWWMACTIFWSTFAQYFCQHFKQYIGQDLNNICTIYWSRFKQYLHNILVEWSASKCQIGEGKEMAVTIFSRQLLVKWPASKCLRMLVKFFRFVFLFRRCGICQYLNGDHQIWKLLMVFNWSLIVANSLFISSFNCSKAWPEKIIFCDFDLSYVSFGQHWRHTPCNSYSSLRARNSLTRFVW